MGIDGRATDAVVTASSASTAGRRATDDALEGGTVVHAYGVVPGAASVAVPDRGIAGSGVAILDAGPVAAVFSRLSAAEYGVAAWHRFGQDPAWLAAVASDHSAVLARLVEDTDVVPLGLPSTYRDEADLHAMLTGDSALLQAALTAIRGHVEWGIRIVLTREPVPPTRRPTSPRDYLQMRADATMDRQRAKVRCKQLVREAYAALAAAARQSVTSPSRGPLLERRRESALLDSAHLVCRWHRDAFFAAVDQVAERVAAEGLTVEVSGPWPAYSFVDLGDRVRT